MDAIKTELDEPSSPKKLASSKACYTMPVDEDGESTECESDEEELEGYSDFEEPPEGFKSIVSESEAVSKWLANICEVPDTFTDFMQVPAVIFDEKAKKGFPKERGQAYVAEKLQPRIWKIRPKQWRQSMISGRSWKPATLGYFKHGR